MQNRAPIKTVCLALKTPALLYREKLAHTFEEKKKEKKRITAFRFGHITRNPARKQMDTRQSYKEED